MSTFSFKTPGVYIVEDNAVSEAQMTAVPTSTVAFVGYTEKAVINGKSLLMQPTRISSYIEFINIFGGAPAYKFGISEAVAPGDFIAGDKAYTLTQDQSTTYLLYNSMRLFFANGGGDCYIVSVGSYQDAISSDKLTQGLKTLESQSDPALLLIPDAVLLSQDACYQLQQAMVLHCSSLQSRFAVLDIWQGYKKRTFLADDVIEKFRKGIGENGLSYGAAYYPWVNTSIVQDNEINFQLVSNIDVLQKLVGDSLFLFTGPQLASLQLAVSSMNKASGKVINNIHNTLLITSPVYKTIISIINSRLNCLPPAAAVAGLYTYVDTNTGVWKATANITVQQVNGVTVAISQDDQNDLNMPLGGKAVNALRAFPGQGVMVWGARTLDANSLDWRYINVRRTIICIEQTIKYGLQKHVFEPNSSGTWATVNKEITTFLTDMWKTGALCGAKSSDAFTVSVGLGQTMTGTDSINGYMNVSVQVAIVRPAEFIVISIQQQMQRS